jgi:hypothetical protein
MAMSQAAEPPMSHAYFEAIPEPVFEELIVDLRREGRAIEFGLEEVKRCGPKCCEPAAVIDYDQFLRAQRDPEIKAMLQEAIEEGERVVREGRRHW